MKLACEGHERAADAGAAQLLERRMTRDIAFEELGTYPTAVADLLEAAGLEVLKLRGTSLGTRGAAAKRRRTWEPRVFIATQDASRLRERMHGRL